MRDLEYIDPVVRGLLELCRIHGISTSAAQLTDGLALEVDEPLSEGQIGLALRRANMSCRISREPLEKFPASSLPVLVFLKDGRTLVLEAFGATEARVIDPEAAGGRAIWKRGDLLEAYDGRLLVSKPIDLVSSRLDGKEPQKGHWLLRPVLGNVRIYRDVMTASFAANLLAVATALFSMQVYDRVVPNQAFDTLWILASGVGIAIVLEFGKRCRHPTPVQLYGVKFQGSSSSILLAG